jgi:type IV secretory pathway component VirB8
MEMIKMDELSLNIIAVVAIILATIGMVLSFICISMLVGYKNSTHQIVQVPVQQENNMSNNEFEKNMLKEETSFMEDHY